MSKKGAVIGIDLGTTYCCVVVEKNGKFEAIANNNGQRTTPSCVNFDKDQKYVGEKDKTKGVTVYDQKRLIGRKYSDINVTSRLRFWSFNIEEVNGKPAVRVRESGEDKFYYPEQISAMILEYLKNMAQSYMGCEITGAVVTVPAYFNISQRKATEDAARIAGLNVLRIINEPTAAAIAVYGLDETIDDSESFNVLVYDLGGGTFDVSIVSISGSLMEVRATGGDNSLGGEDFNNNMVQHFVDEISERTNVNVFKDKKLLRRLQAQCEKAKRTLSQPNSSKAILELDSIDGKDDWDGEINVAKFTELNEDLFYKTITVVKSCLKDAEMDKSDIKSVVLVGGSTRIPYIRKMIGDFFGDNVEIKTSQNPDETVAMGAAIQASKLSRGDSILPPIEKLLVIDVTPLSLGIETLGGKMSVIVARNSPIPRSATKTYTNHEGQSKIRITIYQGERPLVRDNQELGSFELDFKANDNRDQDYNIEVTFSVDTNGTLEVKAFEKSRNVKNALCITFTGTLDEDEIEEMIKEAERNRREDEKKKQIIDAKVNMESECYNIRRKLRTNDELSDDIKTAIMHKCDYILNWLINLKIDDSSMDKIKTQKNDLNKYLSKMGFNYKLQ